MSVTGHILQYSGPSGDYSDEGASYAAAYLITTDDPLDGPTTIWTYVKANIANIGATYACGNDADTSSFLHTISIPQHVAGSANYWAVTLSYKPLPPGGGGGGGGRDENGDKAANDKDKAAEISIRYALSSKPVEKATYRGGFTHAPAKFSDGDEIVPQNSALDPFDPPMEKDSPTQVIRITKTVDTWDGDTADLYFNKVNSSALTWKAWVDATQTFAVRTLKVNAIDATHKWNVDEWDWEVTIELHYKPDGWREDVVDRGNHTILEAGDDDGRGGIVSPSDLPAGVMAKKVPVDHDGLSALGPVLLNGAGKLLALGGATVYITYQIYDEANILLCPVLDYALEAAP